MLYRFCWEQKGAIPIYRLCTAIAPFWFSTEHRWVVIALFWLTMISSVESQKGIIAAQDVLLRTRRVLLMYKVNGNSALLVLNGTSLICNSALLALSWRYRHSLVIASWGIRNTFHQNISYFTILYETLWDHFLFPFPFNLPLYFLRLFLLLFFFLPLTLFPGAASVTYTRPDKSQLVSPERIP